LEVCDVAFTGLGAADQPVKVGIELKSVTEIYTDLMVHRFSGFQLPQMVAKYPERYVIVEGWVKVGYGTAAALQVPGGGRGKWVPASLGQSAKSRPVSYQMFASYIEDIVTLTGTRVYRTSGRMETAALLATLYHWWEVGAEHHRGLDAHYTPPEPKIPLKQPLGLVGKMACCLEGVSWGKARAIEEAFGTPAAMVAADEAAWRAIPGIGRKLAAAAMGQLR